MARGSNRLVDCGHSNSQQDSQACQGKLTNWTAPECLQCRFTYRPDFRHQPAFSVLTPCAGYTTMPRIPVMQFLHSSLFTGVSQQWHGANGSTSVFHLQEQVVVCVAASQGAAASRGEGSLPFNDLRLLSQSIVADTVSSRILNIR